MRQSQDDDNLSNIDLARALIESGEKEKAKEIIINIIKQDHLMKLMRQDF